MILHADLDAFYAAVAQRDDPRLRGIPLVVSGRSRRAVVLTASYEARPFGVRSAMPLFMALERCPQLTVVPPDFEKYREASRAVFAILRDEARIVERLSLDEAFCDLGDCDVDEAVGLAKRVKQSVLNATRLTISIGVATSKTVAKIACDDGKPDGLVVVPPLTEAEYLADKPVSRMWGVGPKTDARLRAAGIEQIGQLALLDDERLFALFGRWGREMRDLARGVDRRPVSDDESVRSISSEETFEHDITDVPSLVAAVRAQASELAERLRGRGLVAKTVGVKVKLADFSVHGRQTSLAHPTDDHRIIGAAAVFCLQRASVEGSRVRLIGTKVAALTTAGPKQLGLFSQMASSGAIQPASHTSAEREGRPAVLSNNLTPGKGSR
jgi:DNA polymerase-4